MQALLPLHHSETMAVGDGAASEIVMDHEALPVAVAVVLLDPLCQQSLDGLVHHVQPVARQVQVHAVRGLPAPAALGSDGRMRRPAVVEARRVQAGVVQDDEASVRQQVLAQDSPHHLL